MLGCSVGVELTQSNHFFRHGSLTKVPAQEQEAGLRFVTNGGVICYFLNVPLSSPLCHEILTVDSIHISWHLSFK